MVKSARKCCVCFGLNQDANSKRGQVAHIDGNRDNNREANLAFLCLFHHDELDSSTSQSKGLTADEVRYYRDRLHELVRSVRELPSNAASALDGEWESEVGVRGISIKLIGAGVYRAWGDGVDDPSKPSPNIGLFDLVARGSDEMLRLRDRETGAEMRIDIWFADGKLEVIDQTDMGYFGHGVSFSGSYRRVGDATRLPNFDF